MWSSLLSPDSYFSIPLSHSIDTFVLVVWLVGFFLKFYSVIVEFSLICCSPSSPFWEVCFLLKENSWPLCCSIFPLNSPPLNQDLPFLYHSYEELFLPALLSCNFQRVGQFLSNKLKFFTCLFPAFCYSGILKGLMKTLKCNSYTLLCQGI